MSVFEHPSFDGHELVLFATDPETQLKALIAVHSTALGPACGGCRLWSYDSSEAALKDVLRLSQGMSYKNAVADLSLGGGKSVIMKPEGDWDRAALFQAFGRAVESLGGRYYTAEDVGVSPSDLVNTSKETQYVVGLPDGPAASGDPSPHTAKGVFLALKACVKHKLNRDDLTGVTVAVQGLGHVGSYLCEHLHAAGAKLVVTDINEASVRNAVERFDARAVPSDEIYDQDVDVYAPCALGSVINDDTIDRIKAKIIAGAANNVLDTPAMGQALMDRDILYAPDYVINGGGIINVEGEVKGRYDLAWVDRKLVTLSETVLQVVKRAEREGRPSNQVADEMAQEVIDEAKQRRKAA